MNAEPVRLAYLPLHYFGASSLSSFLYTLDNDSRRTGVTELDGSTVSWGYDGASRLTSEVRTGTNPYSISYTLDGNSNRTQEVVGTATTSLSYDNDDELNSTSSTTGGFVNSYSYNANGEQTGRTLSGTSYTLGFDYDGQISSITQGTSTVSFGYDALGRRISRSAGGTTTDFQLLGQYFPLLEKQGSATTAAYTYGNELVRMNGEYPLDDGQGSERTVTNSSQTVTGTLNLDSFGNQVGSTGSSSDPYMYEGQFAYRNDGDAGLTLVGARYYDGQVGRFASRDTWLDQLPYSYCGGDPLDWVDPDGHWPINWKQVAHYAWDGWWTGVGGIAGGAVGGPWGGVVGGEIGLIGGEMAWQKWFGPDTPPGPGEPPPAIEPPGGGGGEGIGGPDDGLPWYEWPEVEQALENLPPP